MTPTAPSTGHAVTSVPANSPPAAPPVHWYDELMVRLAELDKLRAERTPYPDQAEVTADWNWIHDQIRARAVGSGQGQYAAVYRKEVVGLDTDTTRLELAMAHKFPDVHPDRFVIEYVG
jgi:hypothetical protein